MGGKYNKKKWRNNNRRKWRQQKVSVGTIAKIAKKVAIKEQQKKEEPKYAINIFGAVPVDTTQDIGRCIITRGGLFEVATDVASGFLSNVNQEFLQHHPVTYPLDVVQGQAGVVEKVSAGKGMRMADSIVMTGIGIKGYLCLGKDCPNARVHIGIYTSENNLVGRQSYLPQLDGFTLRREIATTEKLNNTKRKRTYTLNHRANEQEVKVPVNIFLKLNRRIKYASSQPDRDAGVMNQQYYQDLRYYAIIYSDIKDEVITGGIAPNIPNADLEATLDRYPTFYGRWTAYYRDS